MAYDDKISEARFIDPDTGAIKIVQLGWPLRDGNIHYVADKHKDHIRCLDCDGAMRVQEGAPSQGGSSIAAPKSYFTPRAGHDDDCVRKLRLAPDSDINVLSAPKIDRKKGYRLHLNTAGISEEYNSRSGAYDISEGGRITITDPDLRAREAFGVRNIQELKAFMDRAKPERLADTKVIFRNIAVNWQDFYIQAKDDPYGLSLLADRAMKRQKGELPPFVLLEVATTRNFHQGRFDPSAPAPIDAIDVSSNKRGARPRFIQLQIWLDGRQNTDIVKSFSEAGTFLVYGLARHHRHETKSKIVDTLNITIRDNGQVIRKNIENNPPTPSPAPRP
ncbi:MAG: hypothetical protein DI551_09150 [Micavibrio aeruginosavorus]|uniref:Uncharacterized protein n=1 Tax=Micavibrio aeruginosavorus TaxID=349221 RepID=A0A2W5MUK3_9BACT|nr:MAG: hypothetical protein DI551_09150 [Micavibrio aeruginosavorus]